MNTFARLLVLSCLAAAACGAGAQAVPPMPPAEAPGEREKMQKSWRDLPSGERERWRNERRERRDAWQQMSPEERHRLRRDIRDAGQAIYPRGHHRRPD